MNEYLYLFRGGDEPAPEETEEQARQHLQRWGAWVQSLADKGRFKSGSPLEVSGKTVHNHGQMITDGPFAEGKELVGGYIIVTCQDINEAVELSKECPIFYRGGSVEVRPITTLGNEQAKIPSP